MVLGGLVAFRPVPSVGEWVFCLLLLWDSKAGVGDGGNVVVRYVKLMSGLDSSGNELAGNSSSFDEEMVEECDKQNEGDE